MLNKLGFLLGVVSLSVLSSGWNAYGRTDNPTGGTAIETTTFTSKLTNAEFMITSQVQPKPKEFYDPIYGLLYSWGCFAYVRNPSAEEGVYATRFAVYCQQEAERKTAVSAARFLLNLWDLCGYYFKSDHPLDPFIVEVFLSWGGEKTGGEQMLVTPPVKGTQKPKKRNLIYIYQTSSLTDPVEWCRELCHEYGHAVLPGITGYSEPEAWANGLLGERLFMRWLVLEAENQRIDGNSIMGAPLEQLIKWKEKQCDALVNKLWQNGLNVRAYNGKDKAAMLEYVALALYVETAYGHEILNRAMKTAGGNRPGDFINGIKFAINEQDAITVNLPSAVKSQSVHLYLPGNGWKPTSPVYITPTQNGWMKIKPKDGKMNITFVKKKTK